MAKAACLNDKSECESCRWIAASVSIVGNTFLALFKAIIGSISGSQALLADAAHSGADVFCMIFAVLGMKIGDKPADRGHPYGHGKIEFIVGSLGGLLLLFVSLKILFNAIHILFFTPQRHIPAPGSLAVWAALFGVYVNFMMSRYTLCAAKQLNSAALEIVGIDDLSDMYSSIPVAIAVIGAQFGMPQLDSFGAIFVGLLVAKLAIELIRKNCNYVIDAAVEPNKIQEIADIIIRLPGVKGIGYLRTRSVGRKIWIDAQIFVDGKNTVTEAERLISEVKGELKKKIPELYNAQIALVSAEGW